MSSPEGPMIARRRLFWLPLALAAWPPRSAGADGPAPPATTSAAGSLEFFAAEAQPIARRLVADASRAGQDAYVYQLAALAARLHAPSSQRSLFALPELTGVRLAPAFRGVPFFVIEWRLDPNALFPPHDHPGYSVCTVVLDGEAEVSHFELAAADGATTARARLVRRAVLGPGSVDTLTPSRDNVHTFRAGPRGVHAFDITTLHAPRDRGFHWLELAADVKPAVGDAVAARLRAG